MQQSAVASQIKLAGCNASDGHADHPEIVVLIELLLAAREQ